jgi:cytochrome c oxidase subunit 2
MKPLVSPVVCLPIVYLMVLLCTGMNSPTQAQDVAAGEAAYQICKTCHGPQGEGQQQLNAPNLTGQFDWYLTRQLQNFKAGIRGADPKDVYGAQMRPMAMTLADDAAIKNVVAYIQTLPVAKPKPTLDGDAEQGKALYTVCATCHGQKAEGNVGLNAPRLNNQQDWYILRQLKNFKEGIRGKHPQDTYGAQMQAMSNTLPDETAMKNVTAYIMSLDQ